MASDDYSRPSLKSRVNKLSVRQSISFRACCTFYVHIFLFKIRSHSVCMHACTCDSFSCVCILLAACQKMFGFSTVDEIVLTQVKYLKHEFTLNFDLSVYIFVLIILKKILNHFPFLVTTDLYFHGVGPARGQDSRIFVIVATLTLSIRTKHSLFIFMNASNI